MAAALPDTVAAERFFAASGERAESASDVRLPQLDVLRTVAVLLVIGHHRVIEPQDAGLLAPAVALMVRFGWTGVELFFVLSGFLIGGLLFSELRRSGSLDIPRFLIRRAFKIWPPYFVYLAGLAVILFFAAPPHQAGVQTLKGVVWQLLPGLLHVQNYFWSARGHLWSLSVEEHFYVLLPLLLTVMIKPGASARRPLAALPLIGLALAATCLVLRCLNVGRAYEPSIHYNPTHLRIDSLFCGVVLSYWYHWQPRVLAPLARHRALAFLVGCCFVSPMMVIDPSHPFVWTVGYSLLYVGYGLILLALVHSPLDPRPATSLSHFWRSSRRAWRCMAWLGSYSYSVYLWHMDAGRLPLQSAVRSGLFGSLPAEARWLLVTVLYVSLAWLCGILAATLVEKPALLLRNRLFPSRATPFTAQVRGGA